MERIPSSTSSSSSTPSTLTMEHHLLHSLLESTNDPDSAYNMIARHPDALNTYVLTSQFNPDVLNVIFAAGYVPPESYIYRVCAIGEIGAVRQLCLHDIFRFSSEDNIYIYAGKKDVADVLLAHGVLNQTMYDLLACIWKSLK